MIKKGFSHIGIFILTVLSLLPLPILLLFARILYYPLYYLVGYRKKVVRENLKRSFPDKSQSEILAIEKTFFKYFVDLVFEVIKMASISRSELNRRVKFKGLEQLETYFKQGKSVLACTGHYGNWELCMLALGTNLSAPAYVIYKPLTNKIFENWFIKIRTQYGNKFVAMRQTLRALTANREVPTMFCFASDQTPTREEAHYFLPFLHQDTAVLLGLEKIALQTNRPIFYFDVTYVKRGFYEIECILLCEEPKLTENHQITHKLFEFLENRIVEAPAYWLWSHRRWKLNTAYAS